MAVDKLVDSTQLDADLASVANAIRTKGGTSAQLAFPSGFVSAINDISGGGTVVVDKLKAIADGDWNPGYTVDSATVMQYLCGTNIYTNGMACVLTPILPIYDGELNVTYYIANKTPAGTNINKINISSTAASYHLYKGNTKSSYYAMATGGANTFNTVISRGSGKNVDNAYTGVKFCVWLYGCEESYCYANETGRILFAGRNSQYYGKTYITDP